MADPMLWFHWSPTSRRKQILRYGLRPGSRSTCGLWKPPFICFSATPSLAWALSVAHRPGIGEWDLWQTWSNVPKGFEVLHDDGDGSAKEFRVYERIFKRDLWFVGSRTQ